MACGLYHMQNALEKATCSRLIIPDGGVPESWQPAWAVIAKSWRGSCVHQGMICIYIWYKLQHVQNTVLAVAC